MNRERKAERMEKREEKEAGRKKKRIRRGLKRQKKSVCYAHLLRKKEQNQENIRRTQPDKN